MTKSFHDVVNESEHDDKKIDMEEDNQQLIMPFSAWQVRPCVGQIFGEPVLEKAGKKFKVRDWIQAGREDTEIYETLEKYGSIERMKVDIKPLYGDMTKIKDLRNIHEMVKKSEELWESLPIEMRREFQHDKKIFMEQGEDWLKNKIKELEKLENTNKEENNGKE